MWSRVASETQHILSVYTHHHVHCSDQAGSGNMQELTYMKTFQVQTNCCGF